ncbi:hypothetical protein GIB67_029979, partial [Kingdonia uniflora]
SAAITDADHYSRLQILRRCPYDQVLIYFSPLQHLRDLCYLVYQVPVAYKTKSQELLNQELEEEELNKKFKLLRESYTILSSEKERRLYDWSLARTGKADTYLWPFKFDISQASAFHQRLHLRYGNFNHEYYLSPSSAKVKKPEPKDVGPTALVGYFMLAWLILGVSSIALNKLFVSIITPF